MIPLPPSLTALAARVSLSGIALAIMAALLAVQTVRLEGFRVWPVSVEGWKPKAQRLEAAQIAARAAYKAQEARQATIATDYEKGRDNASQANAGRIERVRTIYATVPATGDCAPPADVRGLLTEAISAVNASSPGEPVNLLP